LPPTPTEIGSSSPALPERYLGKEGSGRGPRSTDELSPAGGGLRTKNAELLRTKARGSEKGARKRTDLGGGKRTSHYRLKKKKKGNILATAEFIPAANTPQARNWKKK